MLPSKPSEKPWQVVGRGSQKSRAPLQTISNGGDRGPPATQPALRQAPNARVPQTPIHPNSAPKKEKTPYEIKNAREQDPKRRLQVNFSSASSDDDDDDDDDDDVDYCHNSDHNSRLQAFEDDSSRMADDRSHPMISKRSQLNARPRGQPSGHQRARPRVNLNYKRDNLARAAFRKRLAPTGSFTLPKDCPDIEPNQKRMYDMFEEIGVRLGSFMRPPQRVKDRELLLWGDASQVQATIAELIRRFDHRMRVDFPRKVTAKDKFARETSSIGDQHHRLMKKMQKEAKILEFQQVPAEGRVFRYTGTFLWPVDEVHPEDILGSSLEAFDSIRFHYGCHILFDNKGSFFKIFSDTDGSVKETINRIVGTMKEYLAKSVRPDTVILIEPPCSSAVKEDVKLLPVSLKGPKADSSMVPVLTGSPKPPSEWLNQRNVLKTDNNRRMEFALRKCIANLPYYRGLVRMRVQFGTFALRVFRWKEGADSTPLGEFVQNMTMSGTKALMIRDLHIQKDATTIISKVQTATDLFIPMDNFSTSLEEVVPSFSACFEFSSPDSPPMNFTLELSSSPAASTIYEKVQELWTRTDRRDNAVPLEAFVVGLDSGASWKLQVSTENRIDSSRVNPQMTEFAESVKLSKISGTKTEFTGQRVFTWEKERSGVMQPSAFQQKTALRYRLADQPEWCFEIARYDSYGDPKNVNVPVETNWGATLYNTNWDSVLTANSTLGIGEAARWEPKLETFFPSRPGTANMEEGDPGVTEFVKTVEVVTKFIDSIKKEKPHLRGQVGAC